MIFILIFIFSLMIGSFLNVCIYRIPKEESIIKPRSHCPECKNPIPWYDNIPILSYLALRGKCRFCKKNISVHYIIVEILTASLLTFTFLKFGATLEFIIYSTLFCGLIIATFIDFKYQIIPDEVTYVWVVLGLIFSTLHSSIYEVHHWYLGLLNSALGLLIGGISIYAVMKIGTIIFRKKLEKLGEETAMGFGDVTLMAMIGAFLGWKYVLMVFFLAPFFGSAVGIIMKLKYKTDIMPYGPYLSLATIVVVFWGKDIINYLFL